MRSVYEKYDEIGGLAKRLNKSSLAYFCFRFGFSVRQ